MKFKVGDKVVVTPDNKQKIDGLITYQHKNGYFEVKTVFGSLFTSHKKIKLKESESMNEETEVKNSVFIPHEDSKGVTIEELPAFLDHLGLKDCLDFKVRFVKCGMKVEVLK